MNWLSLLSVSFLLCVYPTLDLPKLESKTEIINTQEKLDVAQSDRIQFKAKINTNYNIAATKPFKFKKSKEIL